MSEAQAELSALQLECREVRERLADTEDQLVPLTSKNSKVLHRHYITIMSLIHDGECVVQ